MYRPNLLEERRSPGLCNMAAAEGCESHQDAGADARTLRVPLPRVRAGGGRVRGGPMLDLAFVNDQRLPALVIFPIAPIDRKHQGIRHIGRHCSGDSRFHSSKRPLALLIMFACIDRPTEAMTSSAASTLKAPWVIRSLRPVSTASCRDADCTGQTSNLTGSRCANAKPAAKFDWRWPAPEHYSGSDCIATCCTCYRRSLQCTATFEYRLGDPACRAQFPAVWRAAGC
jgi:hypothetical protein